MEDMGLRDDRLRPKFTRWAVDAENKIGSFYSYKRDYVKVTMDDEHRGELPCHIVAVMGIIMGCVDTTDEAQKIFREQYNYAGSYGNYNATNFLYYPLLGFQTYANTSWEIQNNRIVFMYPQTVEEITLDCMVYEVDCDGLPMINEEHRDAIAQYIKLKRAEESVFNPQATRVGPGDTERIRAEWNRKCSDARANDSDPSASDRAAIVSMINDPLSGCSKAIHIYQNGFSWI
jgi:hypothetical protein